MVMPQNNIQGDSLAYIRFAFTFYILKNTEKKIDARLKLRFLSLCGYVENVDSDKIFCCCFKMKNSSVFHPFQQIIFCS
jgi:hypothetical protein